MIINKDSLRRDTLALLKQINAQIDEINRQAALLGIEGWQMRDASAGWPMVPLLQAKAQAYNTLVLLQTK